MQPLFGHPHLHRVLKDLVKQDASVESSSTLFFSKTLSNILLKDLEATLQTRAVWILVELMEHPNTAVLVNDELLKSIKVVKEQLKQQDKNKGLQILAEKLSSTPAKANKTKK